MATKATTKERISARREQLRAEHADAVREKIQVTHIVKQLEDFALGKGKTKLSPARIKAMEMLLDKTLPNLASVKHEHDPIQVTFNISTEYTPPETHDGA